MSSSSESHQAIIALGSCTLGLSALAVTLRFYSRKLQNVPLLADDWLMVPGLVCSEIDFPLRHHHHITSHSTLLAMYLTSVGVDSCVTLAR
jgi:hypothetical protein